MPYLAIATARGGNVVGGGDCAKDRIMPETMRALAKKHPIIVRNQNATKPWQHMFIPLEGYLLLAEALAGAQASNNKPNPYCEAFNFGPMLEANRTVLELIEAALQLWNGGGGISQVLEPL